MSKQDMFTSPTIGKLPLTRVIEEIAKYLHDEPQSRYRLVIGTDSRDRRTNGRKLTNFVTAIVVHRIGKGGRYFWKNGQEKHIKSLRHKIYTETLRSVEVAQQVVPRLTGKLNGQNNWELEIHIDVGRSGETREMIKEVVGIVIGNGYTAKTKPDSYGASSVADKHC
jgi:predicted RNase H-related nuclease YkuK (DUF458 family)